MPQRAVPMAKALRRMGLDVVQREDKERDDMSSHDVKQVGETAKQIAEVGERARALNESLRQNLAEIHEGLSAGEEVDRQLREASTFLRDAFGTRTNNPPRDEGTDAGSAVSGVTTDDLGH